MVLVDTRKAFDLVDYELILFKLDLYGCRENELAWFRSFLGERYQCVKYHGVLSDPLPVKRCVPQGSILGPLLFITFMNDSILEISDIRLDMYADDSTLYRLYTTGKCVADINRSLTTSSKPIYYWIDANCMVLNADKTECMLVGTRQKLRCANAKFCIRSNNYVVKPVKTHKLLGLHVDSNNYVVKPVKTHKLLGLHVDSNNYVVKPVKTHMLLGLHVDSNNYVVKPVKTHMLLGLHVDSNNYVVKPVKTHKLLGLHVDSNNYVVKPVKTHKLLGLHVDSNNYVVKPVKTQKLLGLHVDSNNYVVKPVKTHKLLGLHVDSNNYVVKPVKTHKLLGLHVDSNNYVVKPVKTHTLLGLHVDSNLSWNVHVTKLCSKLVIR